MEMNLDRAINILKRSIQDGVLSGEEVSSVEFILEYTEYLNKILHEKRPTIDLSISDTNSGIIQEAKNRVILADLEDHIRTVSSNLTWNSKDSVYSEESCKTCKHRLTHTDEHGVFYSCRLSNIGVFSENLCSEYEKCER